MAQTARILSGLVLGLLLGAAAARTGAPLAVLDATATVGGLWLDSLRMTVVPLVFALVVTGTASAVARGAGGVAGRAALLFVVLLLGSAIVGALLGSALLGLWSPLGLDALRAGLSGNQSVPPVPSATEWLRHLIPVNPFVAAAEGAVVPLTLFALIFGLATGRLGEDRTRPLLAAFQVAVDALLVIVRWVMWLAPVGVAALAFGVAVRVGSGIGAALLWYVGVQGIATLVLGVAMYALAVGGGGLRVSTFARTAAPVQAVALSTQSSLAALPAMVAAAARLRLDAATTAATLPLAVALFRLAAPASIVIVTLTLAAMNGIALGPVQLSAVNAAARHRATVVQQRRASRSSSSSPNKRARA